jgi:hypothetical protein
MKAILCCSVFWFYLSAPARFADAQANATQLSPQQQEQQRRVDQTVNTPFDYFGRVIDQDGHPIADAIAHISVMGEVGKTEGETKHEVASDANGFVSLKGIRAFGIIVTVSKVGYLTVGSSEPPGGWSSTKHPTVEKPALFHLQKK